MRISKTAGHPEWYSSRSGDAPGEDLVLDSGFWIQYS